MSSYNHNLMKCADTGLQLRLPVDLVPATQYSRLTNALPVVEGELRTRSGLILIANVTQTAWTYHLTRPNITDSFASTAFTMYSNGFIVGELITITVVFIGPGQSTTMALGSYPVTITAIIDPRTFTFSPGIPVVWNATDTDIFVSAQSVSALALNALTDTVIDNIFRLNQAILGVNGDRIVTLNGRVFHAPLPAGDSFSELVGPISPGGPMANQTMGFSGRPMSIIEFRFTLDSPSWAIFADEQQMYKYRPGPDDGHVEFVPLGNPFPTVEASASAGGAGNLNSTGGSAYDWRYTYVDGLALTESNPSPIMLTPGSTTTTRPTTFTNPAVAGQHPFTAPANAIDGSTTTASTGTTTASSFTSTPVTSLASCQWQGWAVPAGVVDAITLNVMARLLLDINADPQASGSVTISLAYSYDGGSTFNTITSLHKAQVNGTISADTGIQTYSVTVPSSVSPTNLIMRATVVTFARGKTPSLISDGAGADATGSVLIYDINTLIKQEASVNGLTLVNKIARVCVTPSVFAWQTFIRLYRRGGSLTDAWRRVGEFQVSSLVQGVCGAGMLEIDDNVSDTQLSAQPILELDNDQPVTSVVKLNQPLSFIWGPVGLDARVLGCGDPARPESVYFSKPGNADAWPPQNHVEVSDPGTPVIAGCVFNTRTFAFSRESIYELVEGLGTGATYTPFRTPSAHGLYSPFALAIGPAMFFLAKDGIYVTTGGQEQSIVENDIKPLFPTYDTPGESVNGYEAVDMTQSDAMRLRYHNDELYFSYVGRDTGTRQMLIYDLLKKRWRAAQYTTGISELYSEPGTISSLLMGTTAGAVYEAGGAFDPSELDIIENMGFTTVAVSTAFPSTSMFVRAVRYTASGAAAISYETALIVSSTIGIVAALPVAPPSTVKWRVYFGFSGAGSENQFQEFTESGLPLNRQVTIIALGTAGTLPTFNADNRINVAVRTGAHDQGAPLNQKQYGNVIFDLNPAGAAGGSPVTITPLINGETQTRAAINVIGTGRQQVPLDLSDYFAFNTEYEIAWSRTDEGGGVVSDPVIFQYDTLSFVEPVSVLHWQSQPTSFEFPGFVHCRDAYIAIRSTAAVTLTMTIDGVIVQTYTIPSTAGQRLKQYIQFASNKGLMYQFALDSAQQFRIYEPDIETRVKPWLGVLGYQVARVLGGEVNA